MLDNFLLLFSQYLFTLASKVMLFFWSGFSETSVGQTKLSKKISQWEGRLLYRTKCRPQSKLRVKIRSFITFPSEGIRVAIYLCHLSLSHKKGFMSTKLFWFDTILNKSLVPPNDYTLSSRLYRLQASEAKCFL